MPDIGSLSAAIGGLKTATDIAQYLRSTENAYQTADLKLQIADLVDALATAKLSLAEVQKALAAKDAEIQRLNDALKLKDEVVRYQDAYYKVDAQGRPVGDPFCSFCYESRYTLVHINQNPRVRTESLCPSCKSVFPWQRRQNPDA